MKYIYRILSPHKSPDQSLLFVFVVREIQQDRNFEGEFSEFLTLIYLLDDILIGERIKFMGPFCNASYF